MPGDKDQPGIVLLGHFFTSLFDLWTTSIMSKQILSNLSNYSEKVI